MKKPLISFVMVLALLLVPSVTFARGGGGFEYFINMGSDVLGGVPLPAGLMTDYVSGTVMGLSGYGYGITRGGWKVGGFGTFFYTAPISESLPAYDMTVTDAIGGIGGVISGGYGRLGPFTFALNTRLGVGGMGVEMIWPSDEYDWTYWSGAVLLYGSADLEVGMIFVPAMMVSAYAGVQAIVTVSYVMVPVVVPTMGIRITWGRF
jgi:hypothetical protein